MAKFRPIKRDPADPADLRRLGRLWVLFGATVIALVLIAITLSRVL